jgi:hypothetical protein
MAETDSLLKRLVSSFMLDFAGWLLGTAVQTARPLQSELPGTTVAVDQVFRVTLANDRELLLHLEFQGRRSHEPMPWRMLEYMPRLARLHRLDLESVVMYVGRGAGADDTGIYQVNGLDGTPVLAWRYRVIRLWQMPAEELLAARQVAPPEVILPEVVNRMRRVTDEALRRHLLAALVALLPEEEGRCAPSADAVAEKRWSVWSRDYSKKRMNGCWSSPSSGGSSLRGDARARPQGGVKARRRSYCGNYAYVLGPSLKT